MTRWEYLTHTFVSVNDLNKLGEDGWELVSAAYISNRRCTALFFKRPLGGA